MKNIRHNFAGADFGQPDKLSITAIRLRNEPCQPCAGTGKDFERPGARVCEKCHGRGWRIAIAIVTNNPLVYFPASGKFDTELGPLPIR